MILSDSSHLSLSKPWAFPLHRGRPNETAPWRTCSYMRRSLLRCLRSIDEKSSAHSKPSTRSEMKCVFTAATSDICRREFAQSHQAGVWRYAGAVGGKGKTRAASSFLSSRSPFPSLNSGQLPLSLSVHFNQAEKARRREDLSAFERIQDE